MTKIVNDTLLLKAYYDYIQALEAVYLLDVYCHPSIDDYEEVTFQYNRLTFINNFNKHQNHLSLTAVPLISVLEGNC